MQWVPTQQKSKRLIIIHTITYHHIHHHCAICICALKRGELVVASVQGIVPVAIEGGSHRSPHLVSALILRTDDKNDQC